MGWIMRNYSSIRPLHTLVLETTPLARGVHHACHVFFAVIPDTAEQNGFRHSENVPTNARVCSVNPQGWMEHFRHVWYFVTVKYKLVTEKKAAVGIHPPNVFSLFSAEENLAFPIAIVASASCSFLSMPSNWEKVPSVCKSQEGHLLSASAWSFGCFSL